MIELPFFLKYFADYIGAQGQRQGHQLGTILRVQGNNDGGLDQRGSREGDENGLNSGCVLR